MKNNSALLFSETLYQNRFAELAAVRENDLFIIGRNGEIKQPAVF
jgi:hypothetical protein